MARFPPFGLGRGGKCSRGWRDAYTSPRSCRLAGGLEGDWIGGPYLLPEDPVTDLVLHIRNRTMVRNLAVVVERRIKAR